MLAPVIAKLREVASVLSRRSLRTALAIFTVLAALTLFNHQFPIRTLTRRRTRLVHLAMPGRSTPGHNVTLGVCARDPDAAIYHGGHTETLLDRALTGQARANRDGPRIRALLERYLCDARDDDLPAGGLERIVRKRVPEGPNDSAVVAGIGSTRIRPRQIYRRQDVNLQCIPSRVTARPLDAFALFAALASLARFALLASRAL